MFYEVIVGKAMGEALTYTSDEKLPVGTIVEIPLGRTKTIGVVKQRAKRPTFATKNIFAVLYSQPLPRHLLLAAKFITDYYGATEGSAIAMMLPSGISAKNSRSALKRNLPQEATKPIIPAQSKAPKNVQNPDSDTFAETETRAKTKAEAETETETRAKAEIKTAIPLNSRQKAALAALRKAPGTTKLLFGDTGSGKTNLYLSETSRILADGKSAIILVPEIALTSQLVQIFRQKFGDLVFLMHSQQKPTERRQIFEKILLTNGPKIVLGPRSALFAPVENLGLIVVDEEHESTYYQENTPRYSAIRVASFLASSLSIPCILGSATPNLVDYYLAKQRGTLVRLKGKAKETPTAPNIAQIATPNIVPSTSKNTTRSVPQDTPKDAPRNTTQDIPQKTTRSATKDTATAPSIRLIDLKDRDAFSRNRYFSNALIQAIRRNLAAKRQTLIFHNRRGSAPLTICDSCGEEIVCPECFLPLTLHADTYELICHTCGFHRSVPSVCPSCGAPGLVHKGFGTKLLENELAKLFPKALIRRFDADNKKDETLAATYDAVHDGAVDILVGTQTLAKGLDLPHLATVGVVQADAGLSLPCFAAEERTFQLLTQVIGRVGRGHLDTAEVIVQTFRPEHPLFTFALHNDFTGFADYLLAKRHASGFPPFQFVAQVSCTLKTERLVIAKVRKLAANLVSAGLTISPPMPAFHERTSRGYTWQLIVRNRSRKKLVAALSDLEKSFRVTFDPPSLL